MRQLLADPALRIRMGQKGRQRYERHFTLEHTVEKTLGVYHEILAGSAIRPRAGSRGRVATEVERR